MGYLDSLRDWVEDKVETLDYWTGLLTGNHNVENPRNSSKDASRDQYVADELIREIVPVYGPYLRVKDTVSYWQDYLDATGLTWDDIRYHKVNLGASSVVYSSMSTLNFVSNNINRLYKNR